MNEFQTVPGQNPEVSAQQQYSNRILGQLIHPASEADAKEGEMAIFFTWKYPTGLHELLVDVIEQSPNDDALKRVYPMFANRLGLQKIRKSLRRHAEGNPDFESTLIKADQILGFSTEAHPKNTITELYEEVGETFKEYTPNHALDQKEADLLKKVFTPDGHLLDLGCGPSARHMKQLRIDNRVVTGIDYVQGNVDKALADNPDFDIRQADWQQLPFPDNSFDGAYSLGRSLLHNTTVADWIVTLQEIWRVLDHRHPFDSPKALVIDIPNANLGDYQYEIKRFRETAHKLGIHDYEYGCIHDSPDGIHYFDRFVPTQLQFETMAKIGGFTATLDSQEKYHNPQTNRTNENQYWVLVNNKFPLNYQQSIHYMRELTTKPIVDIDMSHMVGRRPMTWKKMAGITNSTKG